MHLRRLLPWGGLLALQAAVTSALRVSNTILILARDAASASNAHSGLRGYGIPYEVVLVPQQGASLPSLTTSSTSGKYGGIIVLGEVGYNYPDGSWHSALTTAQWQSLYDYQVTFGVRMVRLDAPPSAESGTAAAAGTGCCATGVDQLVSITDESEFLTANLKIHVGLSTTGLWHNPATITNTSIAYPVAEFAPNDVVPSSTTAAVINRIGRRQQMVFFIAWATEWSVTSNYLQHAYIHWMTRGLFIGRRQIYLNTQVDDVHLGTPIYQSGGIEGPEYRLTTIDLEAHKAWQDDINSRLPSGSAYFIEMAHNGNGDIIVATDLEYGWEYCDPSSAVDYVSPPDTALEFMKPPGSGTDLWPPEFQEYRWTVECARLDEVATWFMDPANRDAFAHVSHTFTHLELNNATYEDAWREIAFNRDWLNQVGISAGARFSQFGLVPPAITGLHNADAIRAWLDNGIRYVVGDNTRPLLRNPDNDFWPKISNKADNGYDGLVIIPRWATTIYYNCDLPLCTLTEWIETSGGKGDFEALLEDAKATNIRHLLGLHPDPFMFHQANMRTDVDTTTAGSVTGRLSLLQIWVETVTNELTRLTNWPIRSLKHDHIAYLFLNRMSLDQCNPNLTYEFSDDTRHIIGVTVTVRNNRCDALVPLTVPGYVSTDAQDVVADQVGTEPLIIWTRLSGSPATFRLDRPIQV